MKRIIGLVVGSLVLCAPLFAEGHDNDRKPADQEHASSSTTQTPLPPGLKKQGKLPPGLEKKGKTPHGWSQGKAEWKQPGQTPQGRHSTGNGGVVGGGHTNHPNQGHGHR